MITFSDIISRLNDFWSQQGCAVLQPYDAPMGAGTFHPATALRSLGPQPWAAAYPQPSRRPADGRYGENPNRLQHYYQYQVIIKPSPDNIQQLYLDSLFAIGIVQSEHDVRFVEDDWESPTLGAWGLGWEVWIDGMEVTQFTYFQQVGGIECSPVPVEITYGLERLAMYIQGVDSVFDIVYNATIDEAGEAHNITTYGDIYLAQEQQFSAYNFEFAPVADLEGEFSLAEGQVALLLKQNLPLPAYDYVLKASHAFNLLDARGAISATERMGYILRVRTIAKAVCEAYLASVSEPAAKSTVNSVTEPDEVTVQPNNDASADASSRNGVLIPGDKTPQTFLFELGVEEIPAGMLENGAKQLEQSVTQLLAQHRLEHGEIHSYFTPRRLVLLIDQMAVGSTPLASRARGPKFAQAYDNDGKPTQACLGFAKSKGIEVAALQKGVEDGTEYVYANIEVKARAAQAILSEIIPEAVLSIKWPKSQRWGSSSQRFARPVRWILSLFESNIVDIELFGLRSSNVSYGNRLISPAAIEISSADDYLTEIQQHWVVPSAAMRADHIRAKIKLIEQASGLTARLPQHTFAEVVNLVEFPSVLEAEFEPEYLALPPEIIEDALLKHQRYFPMLDENGKLTNHFLIVSNGSPSFASAISAGNERVVRPRLADARFFFEQDRRQPLSGYVEQLKSVTYVDKLGTLYDKTTRIEWLTNQLLELAKITDSAIVADAKRIARLCKADLVTSAVIEFPSLQGIMGSYYAQLSGENAAVSAGVAQHYWPKFAGDKLPKSQAATIVALADKLDTVCGIFAYSTAPTGSSDPFAVRRAAIGVVNILLSGLNISNISNISNIFLSKAIHLALANLGIKVKDRAALLANINEFMAGRIEGVLVEQGLDRELVLATLAPSFSPALANVKDSSLAYYDLDPSLVQAKVTALTKLKTQQYTVLVDMVESYKRANNLADAKLGTSVRNSLCGKAESALLLKLPAVAQGVFDAIVARKYDAAIKFLHSLKAPLDAVFDEVMINDKNKELKTNRLSLLNLYVQTFNVLADFSKIEISDK